ncbi:hypothetical protein PCE31106_01305 [Pandoraea cepalis]|uniref:Acyltransferase 3 domain-containing protein n=1 Tax=Pandoraea cepalis TaxID=2508294 RepID=A0A5E4TA70_9BURK|nr:hypothetical protein PCE31106_01305 [Pandoraea cepalis]
MVVLIHHSALAFAPQFKIFASNHWYSFLINGTGAVFFFFVLSGFVLFKNGQPVGPATILKRYPRLALTAAISTIISYVLYRQGFYHNIEAAKISNSYWLRDFLFVGKIHEHKIPALDAVTTGFTTFFTGVSYNYVLWTMRPELLGSLLVFLTVPYVAKCASLTPKVVTFLAMVFFCMMSNNYLIPFVAGMFLANEAAHLIPARLSTAKGVLMLSTGLFLLGFTEFSGAFAFLRFVTWLDFGDETRHVIAINTAGSCFVIYSALRTDSIFNALNRAIPVFLGRISFSLYLLHNLVIASAGSWAFVHLAKYMENPMLAFITSTALVIAVTVPAAFLLTLLDEHWIRALNYAHLKIAQRFGSIGTGRSQESSATLS